MVVAAATVFEKQTLDLFREQTFYLMPPCPPSFSIPLEIGPPTKIIYYCNMQGHQRTRFSTQTLSTLAANSYFSRDFGKYRMREKYIKYVRI